jgi:hypothetical protein
LAEELLYRDVLGNDPKAHKVLDGCWLLSPKVNQPYRQRYAVFVLPEIYPDGSSVESAIQQWQARNGWQTCAAFLHRAAFGIYVVGAIAQHLDHDLAMDWVVYRYHDEGLFKENSSPFERWPGGRGRASKGEVWAPQLIMDYQELTNAQRTQITLRQAFFYGYLKSTLRLTLYDPYDIDAFIVGYGGQVMPVEIKEKSRTQDGSFGLDVGRILMMLRVGMSADTNGLYLIRELSPDSGRVFRAWQYTTLSDMVMSAQWNAQGGGKGMTGSNTQTIMFSSDIFHPFSLTTLSEDALNALSSLSGQLKRSLDDFKETLGDF